MTYAQRNLNSLEELDGMLQYCKQVALGGSAMVIVEYARRLVLPGLEKSFPGPASINKGG
jgi:hypothetical protein